MLAEPTKPTKPTATTPPDEPRILSAQFTSSPRGARLARGHAVQAMGEWGFLPESDQSCTVALVVAELAANAVQHARTPGRDFAVRLTLDATADVVRIEVADANAAKRPPETLPTAPPEGESGRGLLLVDTLAQRWGTAPRHPVGKTVWADVSLDRSRYEDVSTGDCAGGRR
ncbi:ATP-binding protein [Streptomyces sp. NPDC058632]|uniref:ATP-binding protein n=1 Tax=Streptomyces sp. NPDC058632 TaxID=3346567 RepID=UPI0036539358